MNRVLGVGLPQDKIAPLIWVLWVLGFALFSVFIDRELGYDVGHYYIQTGWAALNDRFATDLAPSEMHSFLNPVWNAFLWILIDNLPGRAVAFILGAIQALGLPALYYFTRRLFIRIGYEPSTPITAGVTLLGFCSAIQALYAGSLVTDDLAATALLAAFALVLPINRQYASPLSLALASGLIGLTVGMKLTNILYAFFFAVFVLMLMPNWQERIKAGLVCALVGILGILLTGGAWAWTLYSEFGNPVFPYYNGIFESPEGPVGDFRDPRYLPNSGIEILWRPFLALFGLKLNLDQTFFDLRFLLTYLSIFVGIIAIIFKAKTAHSGAVRAMLALCVSALVTYVLWSLTFSLERYLTVFWLIGPKFTVAVALFIYPNLFKFQASRLVSLGLAIALIFSTTPPEVRRVQWQSWDEPYIHAEIPDVEKYAETIVAFTGEYPSSFVAPYLPKSTIRTHLVSPDWSRPALENYRYKIRELLSKTDRQLYVVIVDLQDHFARTLRRLADYESVTVDTEKCETLKTSFDHPEEVWYICPAEYSASASAKDAT